MEIHENACNYMHCFTRSRWDSVWLNWNSCNENKIFKVLVMNKKLLLCNIECTGLHCNTFGLLPSCFWSLNVALESTSFLKPVLCSKSIIPLQFQQRQQQLAGVLGFTEITEHCFRIVTFNLNNSNQYT